MTPDLTTPEGRAELRAYYPPGGTLKIDAHMNAALDALDAAHATIERLTAPVTDADLEAIYIFYDPNIERLVLRDVLDAFIASRKEPAP